MRRSTRECPLHGFCRCNELKDHEQKVEETDLNPVLLSEISDEIADFFEKNVSLIARSVCNDKVYQDGYCVMINSIEELPEVVGEDGLPLKFPVIDFDSTTLRG